MRLTWHFSQVMYFKLFDENVLLYLVKSFTELGDIGQVPHKTNNGQ